METVDNPEPLEDSALSGQLSAIERLVLRVGWLEQRRFARDLADFDLTVPQFAVLRTILRVDWQPTMTDLADAMLLRCATITGIIDRLVRMGLVERHRDPKDRRRVLVQLTAEGCQLVDRVRLARMVRVGETLSHLSPEDASELLRLLGVYLETFGQQFGEGEAHEE